MSNNRSYKDTFKNTLAFGGVQILTILISLIRGKAIAMLLGPIGMGINNLFVSSLNIITTFTELGLELSAVREISGNKDDKEKVSKKIRITERLFIFCGVLGAVITALLSPLLSQWTFGNHNYTYSFVLLSFFVFFTAINKSYQTVLRGLQKINMIIKSGIVGSLASLVFSIPFFYFFKENGIVPSLIVTIVATLISSWFFRRKIVISKVQVSIKDIFKDGKEMVQLGIMLIIANFLGILTKYLINIYIGKTGNLADIGFYGAAISIGSQYVGFILASLSADYFPRLSSVNTDAIQMNKVVNEQSEVVLLLATPLLILMMITAPLMIRILLSKEFLVIESFIRFIAIGSFFQVSSFCMGYISFAKNDRKVYLFLEGGLSNILQLIFSILGYYFFGLKGLATAFLLVYFFYFIIITLFTRFKYKYKLDNTTIKILALSCTFVLIVFMIYYFLDNVTANILSCLIFAVTVLVNYYFLNKRLDLKSAILNKIRKKK
ncbi:MULTISPECIES: oligosaccharide flippase family protein [Chryseobacterium]|uniref:O-antigen/teichoic acid export membrane protein n=1 Tax=Chryseobacterium camelliae TaxID=1265445 RepID=A0ABU0TG68_9FLAO|nr:MULTISPECIES: oligosaccharide flippase family protein [Chryseobacterium]MDT3407090.1 O-antigen/teichoic acid export membrane protein [Pseudacidovorax intermedius]MDQ1095118.1 O-antigen/teichoic acid export membrane protein [Chryseobacterium camelliae]MDQ1099056.1 O-antigen/teichoic acid export membrane protein [Chryseobacterium sp. SORGH_AS_1048]MDR6086405.1 O-antigen/teichoic acid export membrane protein [Chryseobacterium sp. SORGH_AS_0909]MDR6130777.1 O-antigen/teichoic acid export membra